MRRSPSIPERPAALQRELPAVMTLDFRPVMGGAWRSSARPHPSGRRNGVLEDGEGNGVLEREMGCWALVGLGSCHEPAMAARRAAPPGDGWGSGLGGDRSGRGWGWSSGCARGPAIGRAPRSSTGMGCGGPQFTSFPYMSRTELRPSFSASTPGRTVFRSPTTTTDIFDGCTYCRATRRTSSAVTAMIFGTRAS